MIASLYLPRWNDVLVEISRTPNQYRYCQKLNRGIKASSNHIRAIVKLLEQNRLVEIIPSPKIKRIRLTEKGDRVTLYFLKIRTELRYQ